MNERTWWATMFGFGRPRQGDAMVHDLEDRLVAVQSSISLAIVRLLAAQREDRPNSKSRIIYEVIDILERERQRSEL
jgi:hypothetical protein